MFILFWLDNFFRNTLNKQTDLDRELERIKQNRLTDKNKSD